MSATIAKLKKVFKLPASASDAQLVAEATRCAAIVADNVTRAEEAAIVSALIFESCGALDEKRARRVIANRGGFAAYKRQKS